MRNKKYFLLTFLLFILTSVSFAEAQVRYICPRLEGLLFSQCRSGPVHVPEPEPLPPATCTGKCYVPVYKYVGYQLYIPKGEDYPGDTRTICQGGEVPGTPCTETYSNEGVYLGCLGGSGASCPGGYVTELIPGTGRPGTPAYCSNQQKQCLDKYTDYDNTPSGGGCSCGSVNSATNSGSGEVGPPPVPVCEVPASNCP